MLRLKLLGIATAGIIILFCASGVLAASGTDTIHEDYYVSHTIPFSSGDYIDISYTAQVTSGPHIDVYFVSSQNYQYFQDSVGFDYYVAMSDEDTTYASNNMRITQHGTYYLIFDNTDVGTMPPMNLEDDVAYVSYDITSVIHYPSTGGNGDGTDGVSDSFDWMLIIGLLVILVVIIAVIGVAVSASKRKQTPPPQQTYQQPPPPPPAPVQQTQQSTPQSKYCQSCGKSIPGDSLLCPYCGAK